MHRWGLFALIVLAFATRFFFFNYPTEVVFDEVHYGKYARSYLTGERHFDIHPPLGKLLLAFSVKAGGASLPDDFKEIGQSYEAKNLFALRFLPALSGALLVMLVYAFAATFTGSRAAGFIAGTLVLFENALIAESRFALLDMFQLLFGFLALALYAAYETKTHAKTRTRAALLVLSGIALGASYSVKWTSLAFAGLIGVMALRTLIKNKSYPQFLLKLGVVSATSLAVYFASFAIHITLQPNPGSGDAYLPSDFHEKPFLTQFVELNKKMLSYGASVRSDHPYASKWYEWPLRRKNIFFWQENIGEERRRELNAELTELARRLESDPRAVSEIKTRIAEIGNEIAQLDREPKRKQEIWLAGNPIGWFFGLAALLAAGVLIVVKLTTYALRDLPLWTPVFLVLGWAANFLPFSELNRTLFLYHYLSSLVFSYVLFGYVLQYLIKKVVGVDSAARRRFGSATIGFLLILVAGGFAALAPITYGLTFTADGLYEVFIRRLL